MKLKCRCLHCGKIVTESYAEKHVCSCCGIKAWVLDEG